MLMDRTREITVKGIGKLTVPVDYVEIQLIIEKQDMDYKKGYESFEKDIIKIQKTIEKAGFSKKELKTSSIRVSPEYDNIRKNGEYAEVFKGYKFITGMKLSFDFESEKLNSIFSHISQSGLSPKIEVSFTVKDKETVKNNLLGEAAKDAESKAKILCKSLGVKLGTLIKVNYNWDEIIFHSPTDFDLCSPRAIELSEDVLCAPSSIDFTPDDISVEDDACFIWEIND